MHVIAHMNTHIHMIACHMHKHTNRRKNKQNKLSVMSVLRGQGVKIITTGSRYLLNRKEDAPGSVRRDQDLRLPLHCFQPEGTDQIHTCIHKFIYQSIHACMH